MNNLSMNDLSMKKALENNTSVNKVPMKLMHLFIVLLFIPVQNSCTRYNDGNIGNLFGLWQMEKQYPDEGVLPPEHLFTSFQGGIICLRYVTQNTNMAGECYGEFLHKDDSLYIRLLEAELEIAALYYNMQPTDTFQISQLTSKKLILKNNRGEWLFRKR